MKAVVAAFNQEKALVGAYSVITNLRMKLFEALATLLVVVTTDNVDNVSILVGYTLLGPLCASRAGASPHTRPILVQGWSPVLAAMVISSMGDLLSFILQLKA